MTGAATAGTKHLVCSSVGTEQQHVSTLRVGKQQELLEPFAGTRSPYIFHFLSFTYCLNDSCNFNESLSATDTATIIPARKIVLPARAAWPMLVASFISPNSLRLCHVQRRDLSDAEALKERGFQLTWCSLVLWPATLREQEGH